LTNGIRVYYADGPKGWIQELQYTFGQTDPNWTPGNVFNASDGASGVGCSIYPSDDAANTTVVDGTNFINVYLRNSSTGTAEQTYTMADNNNTWFDSAVHVPANQLATPGSAFAVTSDGSYDYVFWEQAPGNYTRSQVSPFSSGDLSNFTFMGNGIPNSRLAAVLLDDGPAILYQDVDGDIQLVQQNSNSAAVQFNQTLSAWSNGTSS